MKLGRCPPQVALGRLSAGYSAIPGYVNRDEKYDALNIYHPQRDVEPAKRSSISHL